MRKILLSVLIFVLYFMVTITTSYSIDFIYKDVRGIYHFECINSCGPARIRKSGPCEYFVQSIYYKGKVTACTIEIAARKACGEMKLDRPIRKDLLNPACL